MAFSINRITLLGNCARDPELRYTPNGNAVCSFSIATNHSIKKGNDWEDVPTFHNVVVWGKKGEMVAQNVGKGDKIYVEGRMDNRSWTDQDGVKKYRSEVNAQEVILMSGKKPATRNEEPAEPTQEVNLDDTNLDDLGLDGGLGLEDLDSATAQ